VTTHGEPLKSFMAIDGEGVWMWLEVLYEVQKGTAI